jgi:nucleoside-diphosphate-sugar epimerase
MLNRPVEREHLPPRPGDVLESWGDISAAREKLGWGPAISLEEGLRRTVQWFDESSSPAVPD